MKCTCLVATLAIAAISTAMADGPADNAAETVRAVPPPGIAVEPEDAARLQAALARLDSQLAELRSQLREKPALLQLPDVEIYAKAVRYALQYHEFFEPREIEIAGKHLARGVDLANRLAKGVPIGAVERTRYAPRKSTRTLPRSTVPCNPTAS